MSRVGEAWRAYRPSSWRRTLVVAFAWTAGWAVIAIPVASTGFMTDSRETVIASHDARVSPALDGYATVELGAYLPDIRYPTNHRVGVSVSLAKTNVDDYTTLLQRYALIAGRPDGEIRKVRSLLVDMAISNAVQGAVIGLLGPALWVLVGRRRRSELASRLTWKAGVGAVACLGVVAVAITVEPWNAPALEPNIDDASWQPIAQLFPDTTLPAQAQPLEVRTGLVTTGTKRLVDSALETYRTSVAFYTGVADRAAEQRPLLRRPESGETVALLVSDRHDNVGMDDVARAVADEAGASVLLDAGDDTSTGESWEAFSLDSLDEAFADYDNRYAVTGNHDEGSFVSQYLDNLGFTMLSGVPVDATDDIRLLGAPDPRSSGLGSWRTAAGISLTEQGNQLADTACAADEAGQRITTMLVHDASLGRESLDRGCVDLVVAGHLHVQVGPTQVTGTNGETGTTYSNGTTGGASYAFALGSKLRRDAMVTLITYREGVPVGLQPVTIATTGAYDVSAYISLPGAQ